MHKQYIYLQDLARRRALGVAREVDLARYHNPFDSKEIPSVSEFDEEVTLRFKGLSIRLI